MHRPEGWNTEDIAKENLPLFKWGTQEYAQVIRGIDIGADAMLEALFKLAKESPTGKFIIDSNIITVYARIFDLPEEEE